MKLNIKKLKKIVSSFLIALCAVCSAYEQSQVHAKDYVAKGQMTFFAHRGYSDLYPEESYLAEKKAVKAGFSGLNIDLWSTAKDANGYYDFAVSHSDKLHVISNRYGRLTNLTASQVKKVPLTHGNNASRYREHVILLGNIISLANRYCLPLQLEMKGEWTPEQEDELYNRIQQLKAPAQIECIYRQPLAYMAKKIEENNAQDRFQTNYVCYGRHQDIDYCAANGITRIAVSDKRITKDNFSYAGSRNVSVSVFSPVNTKNTRKIAKKIYSIGVRTYTVASVAWKNSAKR